jgi:hypothetical protein
MQKKINETADAGFRANIGHNTMQGFPVGFGGEV